ncbi:nucleotide pyrophosphohydrolase [Aristaeella hokkaidonensis]|uniref:Nucleotide pyrophosphohydrolase n=1 Tax=Aristaeella hokkaidonensis TaxID=3046382 RepID=A0AC61MZL9_9FIRM|nr:nucleotide pyrophosphohydrolase [Aristaeella hokkaidonensis]QUC67663.1 nucleotide pyrophosphohydrolase [Aristaeella hokkaidonensis]SNT92710.1 NTP pyrophosphatase, house-cleaning of non-canonical NTPs [Aristaeella hokkaidonensis]
MNEIRELMQEVMTFSEERDWDQFHSPVNLAKSIAIEAGELLECYQWSDIADPEAVEEELADVLNYCLQMAAKLNLDPAEIVRKKMKKNAEKYPVEKSRGRSTKYDQL